MGTVDLTGVRRVVFVDSQWHKVGSMLREPRLADLRHVRINNYHTKFWRYQQEGPECLATIEGPNRL